jgi:DNA-binding IclR family transcriptional regulator
MFTVPIRNHENQVIAAVSHFYSISRIIETQLQEFTVLLKQAGSELSEHRGSPLAIV